MDWISQTLSKARQYAQLVIDTINPKTAISIVCPPFLVSAWNVVAVGKTHYAITKTQTKPTSTSDADVTNPSETATTTTADTDPHHEVDADPGETSEEIAQPTENTIEFTETAIESTETAQPTNTIQPTESEQSTELAQPAELAAEPVEIIQTPVPATESVLPIEPEQPAEITQPAELAVEPFKIIEATEIAEPTEPAEKPTEPAQHTKPTEPTESTQPAELTELADEPTEPEQPAEPISPNVDPIELPASPIKIIQLLPTPQPTANEFEPVATTPASPRNKATAEYFMDNYKPDVSAGMGAQGKKSQADKEKAVRNELAEMVKRRKVVVDGE